VAFPFWIIGLLAPLLQDALTGGQDNKTTQTTTTPAPTPFDPAYSMLSPALLSMLAQNVNRLSGAGFPGGKKIGGDMMNDIIAQVSGAWPDIVAGYGGGSNEECRYKCETETRNMGQASYKECFDRCTGKK
jgi:hypothetical protein